MNPTTGKRDYKKHSAQHRRNNGDDRPVMLSETQTPPHENLQNVQQTEPVEKHHRNNHRNNKSERENKQTEAAQFKRTPV